MNHLLRTCKCHWVEGEYQHWGRILDRRSFMPPGTQPRFAPDAPVTSEHMRLELHLDFDEERVWGNTTHDCKAHAENIKMATLDGVALEVEEVTVDGKAAQFDNDGQKITVTLPRKFKRGETFSLNIVHGVTQPRAGLYFTNPDEAYPQRFQTAWSQGQDEDSRYYFPCLDAPNFKQTSEALLYVPSGYFALSNGELAAHKTNASAGKDLWHYRMELPYSTYLFSIVAGAFAAHSEKHKLGTDGGQTELEVRWFVQPGREKEGRNAFANTGGILKFFSDFTGVPYPHQQYSQIAVPDFIFGGMENYTVTTQTDLTLHDDRSHLDFSSDDLVAHEAAHTWFGNLVTARSWAHAWLHESFATYFESLWMRHDKGAEEHDYQLLRDAEAYFFEDAEYRRPIVTHRYEEPIDLFDAHLYPGGAVRLRHLHALLGDETFRAVLKRYLLAHRDNVAETVDLARAIEAETGINYDWWFDQWIFAGGYPSLEIKYEWDQTEKLATVIIKQTQPLDDSGGNNNSANNKSARRYFRLPARLLFHSGATNNGEDVYPVTVEDEESRFVFRLSAKPKMVLFDPNFDIPVKKVKFEKPLPLLLHQLEKAPGPIARLDAAMTLAEKPGAQVVKALGKALQKETFWGVQQRIARALAKIGGEAARDALLEGLKLPHPKARREVVAQLGYFKDDPKVAKALSAMAAKGDQSYYVEGDLARSLGRARVPNAMDLLAGFLDKPSHVEAIRTGAYDGLGHLGDPEALPLLREGMRYGAPAMARAAAIRATGELGRRHHHLRAEIMDMLSAVAEHRDNPAATFRGKMAAIRAMENMGDLAALPVLNRIAQNETDGRIIRMAKETAKALRKKAAKPAEMESIRTDLDQIVKENKSLRDRLETLELKGKTKKPARKAGSKSAK